MGFNECFAYSRLGTSGQTEVTLMQPYLIVLLRYAFPLVSVIDSIPLAACFARSRCNRDAVTEYPPNVAAGGEWDDAPRESGWDIQGGACLLGFQRPSDYEETFSKVQT
jgi:hypothetical protein